MGAKFNSSRHSRGNANFLKRGSNNVICDRSGFKVKVEECKFEWNGWFIRDEDWEERQPLDFLHGIPDNQNPKVSRPESTDVFITTPVTAEDL
jgi:hypothetical protein